MNSKRFHPSGWSRWLVPALLVLLLLGLIATLAIVGLSLLGIRFAS
jgi:hypothetical protein